MSEPWMPLWVGDFMADTTHLTSAQVGQYILLLMVAWRNGGKLPSDKAKLRRIARGAISDAVMAFFEDDGQGGLTQARLERELKKVTAFRAKQSANAKRKWLKNKEQDNATAEPTHIPNGCSHTHTHSKNKTPPTPSRGKKESEDFNSAIANYNTVAEEFGLPKARLPLNAQRAQNLRARLKEVGLSGWNEMLRALVEQPFCLGEGGRGWKANLEFLVKPRGFCQVMEKAYAGCEKIES